MISNTVNPKCMSPSSMRQVAVLLVFSLTFTHAKMKGPNKLIQPQTSNLLARILTFLAIIRFLIIEAKRFSHLENPELISPTVY